MCVPLGYGYWIYLPSSSSEIQFAINGNYLAYLACVVGSLEFALILTNGFELRPVCHNKTNANGNYWGIELKTFLNSPRSFDGGNYIDASLQS